MEGKRVVIQVLGGLLATALSGGIAQAGPQAICVPWQPSNPDIPHVTYSGAEVTLKGIARGGATEYYWDFGDGGSTPWMAVGDPYDLGAAHTYAGMVGQEFIATLHVRDGSGQAHSDTYRTKIYESSDLSNPEHLDVRIDMSVDEGLWWLHRTMIRNASPPFPPFYGEPYGHWSDGAYPLPATATAIDAFQMHGSKANGDYDGNPYVETVQRGLNYLLVYTYSFNISPQTYGDPDVNGNGIGLVANQSSSLTDTRQTYIGGICLVALASSGAPNRVAAMGGANVYGRTYADIVQDMVDFFAFGQVDSGSGRGGWRYHANYGGSDMSTTQWPPLGIMAAEENMGAIVPQFVRDELIHFLDYTQHTGCDNNNGGFGYDYDIHYPNCTKAAAGIICHHFLGTPLTDPKVVSAIGFLYRHWNDTGGSWDYQRVFGNSYVMYAIMKAMRIPEPDILRIEEYNCSTGSTTGNSFDWYYTPPGQSNQGLATYIVGDQQADGSWDDTTGPNPVYNAFSTGWRILILLEGVHIVTPVAEICDCDEQEYDWNQDIHLDGSCSFHPDITRTIVSYEWDFEYDGTFAMDATGPTVTIPGGYPATGQYPVALRVTDDNPTLPQTAIDVCVLDVHPPPHCPHAFAHPVPLGYYIGWVNVPVTFDGSASWDPNDDIVSYDWDLDGDGLFGAEDNDCFGEPSDAVGINPQWTWYAPYDGVVGLRVTDAGGEFEPCSDYDYRTVEIGNHAPVCDPDGPYETCPECTVTLDGSNSYDPDPGDWIVCAWDLDNDGDFDDGAGCQIDFTVGPEIGRVYHVCLRVTDSFGEYCIACTTIEIIPNWPPECEANGPYVGQCQGSVTAIMLDGGGSSDPDGDPLTYLWATDCPNGAFDDDTRVTPLLTVSSVAPCPLTCSVTLTVTDGINEPVPCDPTPVIIEDTVPPTVVAQVVGGTVDDSCAGEVTFTATIEDGCCIDADDVTVEVALLTGNAHLGSPDINKVQMGPNRVEVAGTVPVYDLTGCPATVQVTVAAVDCCANPAEPAVVAADVVDETAPIVVLEAAVGEVEGECEYIVSFLAIIEDNCCVDANDVAVEASLLTGNAILGSPDIDRLQLAPNGAWVVGGVPVYDLTGCPATVQVTVAAVDYCANPAEPVVVTADVVDRTPPEIVCPEPITLERGDKICNEGVQRWLGSASASDKCDVDVRLVEDSAARGFASGFRYDTTTTVTWTAVDDCGNASQCSSMITIKPARRVDATKKGSLLIYPKIEIKWDPAGDVVQDTFLDLSNDYPEDVFVHWYFINGDPPLEAVYVGDPPVLVEPAHDGWNWVNCVTRLTGDEPAYMSAATGLPDGCQPFTILDDGGRPDPEGPAGSRMLRGYAIAYAVDNLGNEVRWNHLKGDAVIINYAASTAWEYSAYAAANHCVEHGAPLLDCVSFDANGVCCNAEMIPGKLDFDAFQYDLAFDKLLLDFYAVGSQALSGDTVVVSVDTDLTLFPVDLDVRQDANPPVITKAHFDIWNMDERMFSGTTRCITLWDQTMLSAYDPPNHFLLRNLQTDKGKARIDGLASAGCGPYSVDAALLGVAAKMLAFSGAGSGLSIGGTTLVGQGEQPATILFDVIEPPGELKVPDRAQSSMSPARFSGGHKR